MGWLFGCEIQAPMNQDGRKKGCDEHELDVTDFVDFFEEAGVLRPAFAFTSASLELPDSSSLEAACFLEPLLEAFDLVAPFALVGVFFGGAFVAAFLVEAAGFLAADSDSGGDELEPRE